MQAVSGLFALHSMGFLQEDRPERFAAVFYTGLGASLLLAGLLFGCRYGKVAFAERDVQKQKQK